MEANNTTEFLKPALLNKGQLPKTNFSHINNLTDDTGMIQHAMFAMPNRKEGYCIDDNARALLLMVLACKDKRNKTAHRLLPVYLSFIHYMQTDNGYFRNFMSYSKSSMDICGSEDSFGRTIMALGYLVNEGSSPLLVRTGAEIFSKAYKHIEHLSSLRGMANSIIGICRFIKYNFPDDLKKNMVTKLAGKMVSMYEQNKQTDWHWFEPVLTYDNAIMPLALLHAYEITRHDNYLSVALESMQFLESKVFHDGILRPIGNQGWCKRGGSTAQFDQQGIDAMAMVLFYREAFEVMHEQKYLDKMHESYEWFLGANDLGLSLYDSSTGGCADGLHAEGINFNQGAESTLAYWVSHIVVESTS
jgi:hypothetical protein